MTGSPTPPTDASSPDRGTNLDEPELRARLLARFYARDPSAEGAFLVGVKTTGIYCLPTCPARKPRPENVVLLADEAAALARGLRACRRCRPDLHGQGIDADRDAVRRLVQTVRAAPERFSDAAALAREAEMGRTKLADLLREHYHLRPAALLAEARLAAAWLRLARSDAPLRAVLEAGLAAGFESASTFHSRFRARFGLTPNEAATLARTPSRGALVPVRLRLPRGLDPEDLLGFLGRDDEGLGERRSGSTVRKALVLDGRPVELCLRFVPGSVDVELRGARGRAPLVDAVECAQRMLGLEQDPGAFVRHCRRIGHDRLVAGRTGTRVPRSATPFEALIWALLGQQVNLTFAARLRARLVRMAGEPTAGGLFAHPSAERVAELDPSALLPLQFSRRKAEVVVRTARAVAERTLDLERLATEPAGVVLAELQSLYGAGPWTARYVALRGFGLADCVPVGDAGIAAALQAYLGLEQRPDAAGQEQALLAFSPFRSLASVHLWKSLASVPKPPRKTS